MNNTTTTTTTTKQLKILLSSPQSLLNLLLLKPLLVCNPFSSSSFFCLLCLLVERWSIFSTCHILWNIYRRFLNVINTFAFMLIYNYRSVCHFFCFIIIITTNYLQYYIFCLTSSRSILQMIVVILPEFKYLYTIIGYKQMVRNEMIRK